MRIRAHASFTLRSEFGEFVSQRSILIKQFFRTVTAQPLFQQAHVLRMLSELRQRNLMRAPRPFNRFAVDDLWSSPTLGGLQDNHGPLRTPGETTFSCF